MSDRIASVYIGDHSSAILYFTATYVTFKGYNYQLHNAWIQKADASLPSELGSQVSSLKAVLINADYENEYGEPQSYMREPLHQRGIYGITPCNVPKPQQGVAAIRCYQETNRFDTSEFPLWAKIEAEIVAAPNSFSALAMALFMGVIAMTDKRVRIDKVSTPIPTKPTRSLLDELLS